MALIATSARSRRATPYFDETLEDEGLRFGPSLFLPAAVTPEVHAGNARFADAIRGTKNHDDAARSAVSDLIWEGEAAAPRLRNLLNQLHERDSDAALSFAGSVRRIAEQSLAQSQERRTAHVSPQSAAKRTIGHYLFPGQVSIEDENFWAEAVADAVPLLGNVRSASQAARDIELAIAALQQGDGWATAGHAAMAVVDGFGAVPVVGNLLAPAKPAIRAAVRATPGLRRVDASWALAKAARQFDRPISVSPEKLFGDVWSDLPHHQQKALKHLQSKITGAGGEDYTNELLTSGGFRHQGDRRVHWGNPTGKPRIYDAETAERFRTIFFDLFSVPDKRSGGRSHYEVKTAGGELSDLQKRADAIISDFENIVYLRQHLDQIPFGFLASQTRRLLQNGRVQFAEEEVNDLIKSMRRARTPEGRPLTALDWLGTISRIAAEATRDGED